MLAQIFQSKLKSFGAALFGKLADLSKITEVQQFRLHVLSRRFHSHFAKSKTYSALAKELHLTKFSEIRDLSSNELIPSTSLERGLSKMAERAAKIVEIGRVAPSFL